MNLDKDLETVIGLAKKAVDAKGRDYIYPDSERDDAGMCMYLTYPRDDDDMPVREQPIGPSCIVGHMMVDAGMSLSDISGYEGQSALGVVPWFGEAARFCSVLQERQDAGNTWGDAFDSAAAAVSR